MKSRSHFQFRQFSVADDLCHMKVGTDAVLLGTWAELNGAERILDIGTGSGVIALIAAQRTRNAFIDGIDIQEAECAQATANVLASPWPDRIRIVQSAIQDFFPSYQYDAILCNPPFFINSLLPPVAGRTTARHTVALTHETLVHQVQRLLSPTGQASFILPEDEGNRFAQQMRAGDLCLSRVCRFRTRPGKKVERLLMTFERRNSIEAREEDLILYDDNNRWSRDYTMLTEDFYLPRKQT